MARRKPFLLRIDPTVLEAVQRWADDELRSVNAQIEFALRRALQAAGRLKRDRRRSRGGSEGSGRPARSGPASGPIG